MIIKILNVKNVGKFRCCSMGKGSEYNFDKNTFFYGPNTKGKSTLTAILKSLCSGDKDPIIGRKTFGVTDNQQISIQVLDSSSKQDTHTFSLNGWNKTYPEMEFFDARFIAQNVYVHETITEDNEKAIETVVFGAQGKKLEEAFRNTEEECQKNATRKSEITREFTRHLGHFQISFNEFKKIVPDLKIEEKIQRKETEIKIYGSQQQISVKLEELLTVLNSNTIQEFEKNLAQTISLKQAEIKNHILNHLKTSTGAWLFLAQGMDLLKIKNNNSTRQCVFCGQDISPNAEKLISIYETLFSDSYKKLSQARKEAEDYFNSWKIEAELRRLLKELSSLGVQVDLEIEIKALNNAIELFREELRLKNDLNYQINFEPLYTIEKSFQDIKTKIQALNINCSNGFNIEEHKKLTEDKLRLEFEAYKNQEPWKNLCAEYEALEANFKILADFRDKALIAKIKYAESTFQNYEKEVNKVLKTLQAEFQLVDMKPKSSLRDTTRLFSICFYGSHKISLCSNQDGVHNFGNSLSESDKRLLAFAFFIACLKIQGNIQDKIIVFDDPLSSLDTERKYLTVNLLKAFIDTENPKQVIILTHEQSFFTMLNEYIPQHKSFKINYDPINKTSVIETMQPNEEYLDSYYKQLEELKALESLKDDEITWDKIRPMRDMLEQLFKRKYYFRIKNEIHNGGCISSYVAKLTTEAVYDDLKAQRVEGLLAHFWNHDDSNSKVKRTDFSPGDIRGIAQNFFEVIEII